MCHKLTPTPTQAIEAVSALRTLKKAPRTLDHGRRLPSSHLFTAFLLRDSMSRQTYPSKVHSDPDILYILTHQVLQQAIDLLDTIPSDEVYAKPSHVMAGGSIGKHVRFSVRAYILYGTLSLSDPLYIF